MFGRAVRLARRVAVLLAALTLAAMLSGCGAEQQAASSADFLVRSLTQQSASSSASGTAGTPNRPTTPPAAQPRAKASLLAHGNRAGRKVVAIAVQMYAQPGKASSVNSDVLNTLDVDQVRATVFLPAIWTQAHPDVAAQIGKAPQLEVGNGGYSSEYLGKLKPALIKERTLRAQQVIRAATGERPTLYRDAQTGYTPAAIGAIAAAGVRPVSGDIDLTTPKAKLSAQAIAKDALARVHSGSIIVVRGDTSDPRTVRALVLVLGGLKRAGFEDVTVSQLLGFGKP